MTSGKGLAGWGIALAGMVGLLGLVFFFLGRGERDATAQAPRSPGVPIRESAGGEVLSSPELEDQVQSPGGGEAANAPQHAGRQEVSSPADGGLGELVLEVVHADEEPAPGVLLLVLVGDQVHAQGRADDRGRARFAPRAEAVSVVALGSSCAPSQTELEAAHGEHRIVLPAGAEVRGQVLINGEPPEEPIALGLSHGWSPELEVLQELWGWGRPTAWTGPEGTFRFTGLEVGQETRLQIPGWLEAEDEKLLMIVAPATDLVIELSCGPVLRGRVVSPDGHAPVPFAQITYSLHTPQMGIGSGTQSDSDGVFRISTDGMQPEAGTADLEIWPQDRSAGRILQLEVPDFGEDHDAGDLLLAEARSVAFFAVDPQGRPIEGAVATSEGGATSQPTNSLGQGLLPGVLPNEASMTVVGLLTAESRVELPAGPLEPEAPLEVVLYPAAILEILVEDRLGEPVPDLRVSVHTKGPLFDGDAAQEISEARVAAGASPSRGWGVRRNGDDILEISTRFVTDERGRVFLPGVLPGVAFSVAVGDMVGYLLAPEEHFVIAAHEHRRVEIVTPGELRPLHGVLRAPDGTPMAGVRVRLTASDGRAEHEKLQESGQATTDTEGHFELEPILAERVDVHVEVPDYATLRRAGVSLPRDGSLLELWLEDGRSIPVRVTDSEGVAVDSGQLRAELREQPVGRALKEAGGFRLVDLPGGDLEAVFLLGGREFRQGFGSEQEELVIEIPSMGSVEVAWGLEGLPPDFYMVRLEPVDVGDAGAEDLVHWRNKRSGERPSNHAFEAVFPGTYLARVVERTRAGAESVLRDLVPPRTVEVVAGAGTRVELRP